MDIQIISSFIKRNKRGDEKCILLPISVLPKGSMGCPCIELGLLFSWPRRFELGLGLQLAASGLIRTSPTQPAGHFGEIVNYEILVIGSFSMWA